MFTEQDVKQLTPLDLKLRRGGLCVSAYVRLHLEEDDELEIGPHLAFSPLNKGTACDFIVDTGALITVMSHSFWTKCVPSNSSIIREVPNDSLRAAALLYGHGDLELNEAVSIIRENPSVHGVGGTIPAKLAMCDLFFDVPFSNRQTSQSTMIRFPDVLVKLAEKDLKGSMNLLGLTALLGGGLCVDFREVSSMPKSFHKSLISVTNEHCFPLDC